MQRVDTREARSQAAAMRLALEEPGARCPKRQALHLVGITERLAAALDEAQTTLIRRDSYTEPYARLVAEWNALSDGLRDLGIHVAQAYPGTAWHWAYAGRSGSEATIPAAYLAALRSAGVGAVSEQEGDSREQS
jgi:hypothetical protein